MSQIQRAYTAHCDRSELVRSVAAIYASAHEALLRAAQQMREHGEPNGAALLEQHAFDVDGEGAEHIDALTQASTPPTPERCSDASSHETASQQSPTVAEGDRVAPRASDGRAELLSEYRTDDGESYTPVSVFAEIAKARRVVQSMTAHGTQQREQAEKFLAVAYEHVERAMRSKAERIYLKHAAQKVDAALRVMGAVR